MKKYGVTKRVLIPLMLIISGTLMLLPVAWASDELPLHSVTLPDFAKIRDIKQKKKAFFNFIKPAIISENKKLLALRQEVQSWLGKSLNQEALSSQEKVKLLALVNHYKVNTSASLSDQLNSLLLRIDLVPVPLVLVQAANESAWGTSRFARMGLNFFGIWCYRPTCGMVPKHRQADAKHEVAAFKSVNTAVKRYLYNINTNRAYRLFRTMRKQLREEGKPLKAEVLVQGLLSYSERGADYVTELSDMIRQNRAYFDVNAEGNEKS